MTSAVLSFFISLLITLFVIRYQHLHQHLTHDTQEGPQKFHAAATPRVGGIGIFLALIIVLGYRSITNKPDWEVYLWLLLCCLPPFSIGLLEDLTKRVSVKVRLAGTALGACLAILFLGVLIHKIQLPGLDWLLGFTAFAWIFTIVAITGLSNAYNIIDGFNGLASMVGMLTLYGIAYVAFSVGDWNILAMAMILVAAIAGFFIWNYPRGLIFLGDGGAYLIGFYVAVLSILLVKRHSEVSPWFSLLINAYPIFETLFTIWRRKVHQGKNPGLPDGAHFHSMIYRRVVRWAQGNDEHSASFIRNARTSPYLWLLSTLAIFPAILWWQYTWVLQSFTLAFCISYVYIYRALVTFKIPRWFK